MSKTLKGCRPLEDVRLDYTNTCAIYGSLKYRIKTLHKDAEKLEKRIDEIQLEMKDSEEQEAKLKVKLAEAPKEEPMEGLVGEIHL